MAGLWLPRPRGRIDDPRLQLLLSAEVTHTKFAATFGDSAGRSFVTNQHKGKFGKTIFRGVNTPRITSRGFLGNGSQALEANTVFDLDAAGDTIGVFGYTHPSTGDAGAFVKIGSGTDGIGFGIGNATFDSTGSELVVLREVIAWNNTLVNISAGFHTLVFKHNSTAVEIYVDGTSVFSIGGGYSINAPTATTFFGGYSGIRTISGQLHFAALLHNADSGNDVHGRIARRAAILYPPGSWTEWGETSPPIFYSLPSGGTTDGAITEAATATDSISASVVFAQPHTESVTATDTQAGLLVIESAVTEAASTTDALTGGLLVTDSVTEGATATDVVSVTATLPATLTESATAADSVSAAAVLAGALTESATAADTATAALIAVGTITESIGATDVTNGSIDANTYEVSVSESASAGDSVSAQAAFAASVTESASATDALASAAVLAEVLPELASAADAIVAAGVLSVAVSEFANATDSMNGVVGAQTFNETVAESASATDVFNAAEILAQFGVRGAVSVGAQRQASSRRAQVQTSRRRN